MPYNLDYARTGMLDTRRRSTLAIVAVVVSLLAAGVCVCVAVVVIRDVAAPRGGRGSDAMGLSPWILLAAVSPPLLAITALITSIIALSRTWRGDRWSRRLSWWAMSFASLGTFAMVAAIGALAYEPHLARQRSIDMYLANGRAFAAQLASAPTTTSQSFAVFTNDMLPIAATATEAKHVITAVSFDVSYDHGRVICFADGSCRYVPNAQLDACLDQDDSARRSLRAPAIRSCLRTYMGVRTR